MSAGRCILKIPSLFVSFVKEWMGCVERLLSDCTPKALRATPFGRGKASSLLCACSSACRVIASRHLQGKHRGPREGQELISAYSTEMYQTCLLYAHIKLVMLSLLQVPEVAAVLMQSPEARHAS